MYVLKLGGYVVIVIFGFVGFMKCSGLDVVYYDVLGFVWVIGDDFWLWDVLLEEY